MEHYFPKPSKMPRSRITHPGGRIPGSFRNTPSLGSSIKPVIDHFRNTPSLGTIKPAIDLFGKKPAFHQTGLDLRALLRSRHTKETIHRGKHGPDMGHAANLFDTAHHAGGMGAVRGGHHVGHGKFTYKNHLGNQVKVPTGWEVDNFGSAHDPTKPHPM